MIYTIKAKFQTDRELTPQEIEWLLGSIGLQIEEPQDYEGNELNYGTVVHETTIEGEGE